MRRDLGILFSLAWPTAATQVGMLLFGIVDIWMLGRLGSTAIAAAGLADVIGFGSLIFGFGLVMGIDPIVTQAHGAGGTAARASGLALQRGLVLAGLVSIPIGLIWLQADTLLRVFGQSEHIASLGWSYLAVQLPSIPFILAFAAMRQYLQGREMIFVPLGVVLFGNVCNVAFNEALIFGKFGAPELGIVGAGVATGLSRVVIALGLVGVIAWRRLHAGAWQPWSRASFRWSGLRDVGRFGLVIGIQLCLEVWAFSAATVMAGRIGENEAAAHVIALKVISLVFMVPLGISIAAATRVGNLLGAGHPARAQRSAWIAIGFAGVIMCVSAFFFVVGRHVLGDIFTDDPTVLALAATLFPIAAAFQLFDGTQVVGGGVLRGMGTPRPSAVFNLIGYYGVALPLGYVLAFWADWGLVGIWTGLGAGLGLVAIALLAWIAKRGPATVTQLAISPPSVRSPAAQKTRDRSD